MPTNESPPWLWKSLACPECNRRLEPGELVDGAGTLRCVACGPYPVLGGVPILVPDASTWCAAFSDAALAALTEAGLGSRHAVNVLKAFAFAAGVVEPRRFGDNWTRTEAAGEPVPEPQEGAGRAPLKRLMSIARGKNGTRSWLLESLAQKAALLEVGCGAGQLSEVLAKRAGRLIVGDVSLRAVLRARFLASRVGDEVAGVVMDAAALPLQPGVVDVVLSENMVEELDDPLAFFESAWRVLKVGGQLRLTTPGPSLGAPDVDDSMVERTAERQGFVVERRCDGVPWVRVNSSRSVEVFLVQGLFLHRGTKRKPTAAMRPRKAQAGHRTARR